MADERDSTRAVEEEAIHLIRDDLYRGRAAEVERQVHEVLGRGLAPSELLNRGLIVAMEAVGRDFRDGKLFVPEVLMAAKAMKAGMEILRPRLAETGAWTIGTVVIATVKGDIHDIGKNLVAMMLEGAGFEVVDLGINRSAEDFVAAVETHRPAIVGLSALLTTTMPYMGDVIEALEKEGLREDVAVLVGGAPLNEAFAQQIKADAYCRDAVVAVDTAKKLSALRR